MTTSRFWQRHSSREGTPRQPAGKPCERDTSHRRPRLHSFAALTVLAGVAVLPLGAAQAASAGGAAHGSKASAGCPAEIKVPNVGIHQSSPGMFQEIQGTLVQSCNAADAKWHADYNSQTQGTWDFAGTATALLPLPYGSAHMGRYQVLPAGAVDEAGNPVPQAAASFVVKFSSRSQIKGYRSGSYVHLRAHASRFNWSLNRGYGAFQPSVNRDVELYEWSHGAWVDIASLGTGADGWTASVRVRAPAEHKFYAQVLQTTSIWGASSRTIDR